MEGKLYIVNCCSDYNNGDYVEFGCYDIGVYSTLDLAEQAGQNELQENYKWNEEDKKYYDGYSDKAWIEIHECRINEKIDLNQEPIKYIPEKEAKRQ